MGFSMHGFSEEEWIGYLEGSLPAEDRRAFESHLGACAPCARRASGLAGLGEALRAAGGRRRGRVNTGPDRVARIEKAVLARAGLGPASAPRFLVAQSIQVLRACLEPTCGTSSADRVIRLAARRSVPAGVDELTGAHWPAFVSHLGDILASLCGASAARSIVQMARTLGVEDAA